ncbi:MAG: hypothetical protein GF411_15940 [Candidatus Lokiarchaeota archaeon]|nr:hypothetical protein [Candidatus Lokiarchaeota archaeon]
MSTSGIDANEIIFLFEQSEKQKSFSGIRNKFEELDILFEFNPLNPISWNALAVVYILTERIQQSEEVICYSLELDSGNYLTWRIWGKLLHHIGKNREAENAFGWHMN